MRLRAKGRSRRAGRGNEFFGVLRGASATSPPGRRIRMRHAAVPTWRRIPGSLGPRACMSMQRTGHNGALARNILAPTNLGHKRLAKAHPVVHRQRHVHVHRSRCCTASWCKSVRAGACGGPTACWRSRGCGIPDRRASVPGTCGSAPPPGGCKGASSTPRSEGGSRPWWLRWTATSRPQPADRKFDVRKPACLCATPVGWGQGQHISEQQASQ